ncbi:MAG: hypothetical protein GY749_17660 [Desulfobacteraceae bacterium]|nr:hypothetical protein [Desulfobacteraceae bacterium]
MKIEDYFRKIQNTADSCAVVRLKNITYDKRGTYEGFIRGELHFSDGSVLHFREFTDTGTTPPERIMYTYHYADSADRLIFRYDNTGHHRKLGLPTWPHHKHEGSETNVTASEAPELDKVLQEIELMIQVR